MSRPRMNTWAESLFGTFIQRGQMFTLCAGREQYSLQGGRACPTLADVARSGLAAGQDTGRKLRNPVFSDYNVGFKSSKSESGHSCFFDHLVA
jgi:hypothetical protein